METNTTSTATSPVSSAIGSTNNEYAYLALGDSYTIGERVLSTERWSVQLADMLNRNGKKVLSPEIIAQTGWTTAELAQAIKASGNRKKYSLVSLLIGVNNQYRGQSMEVYRKEFRDLLATAVSYAGMNPEHVFVLSIPDWGVTPYASTFNREKVAREIDAFNDIAADECHQAGIPFIDITPLSRAYGTDVSYIADDELHFSGKMYHLWAEKALSVVEPLLR